MFLLICWRQTDSKLNKKGIKTKNKNAIDSSEDNMVDKR